MRLMEVLSNGPISYSFENLGKQINTKVGFCGHSIWPPMASFILSTFQREGLGTRLVYEYKNCAILLRFSRKPEKTETSHFADSDLETKLDGY